MKTPHVQKGNLFTGSGGNIKGAGGVALWHVGKLNPWDGPRRLNPALLSARAGLQKRHSLKACNLKTLPATRVLTVRHIVHPDEIGPSF